MVTTLNVDESCRLTDTAKYFSVVRAAADSSFFSTYDTFSYLYGKMTNRHVGDKLFAHYRVLLSITTLDALDFTLPDFIIPA